MADVVTSSGGTGLVVLVIVGAVAAGAYVLLTRAHAAGPAAAGTNPSPDPFGAIGAGVGGAGKGLLNVFQNANANWKKSPIGNDVNSLLGAPGAALSSAAQKGGQLVTWAGQEFTAGVNEGDSLVNGAAQDLSNITGGFL